MVSEVCNAFAACQLPPQLCISVASLRLFSLAASVSVSSISVSSFWTAASSAHSLVLGTAWCYWRVCRTRLNGKTIIYNNKQ